MSWLDNFKAPSPAPPEQPPPAYEAAIRDDDPSGTAQAPEIDPPSSSTEDASAARVDPPREAPEPETDALTAPEPSPGTSGPARPDPDLEPPRPAEPPGTSPIAVPSFAEDPKEDDAAAAADDADATIRSLRSELAVSAAAAEDATAALEAMTLKADTLARLLDEASSSDAKDASSSQTQNDVQKTKDELRDVSKQLEASESKRAELESAVTRLETRVVSLSNDLSAAREIARSTGELADQSATYIAELKKKHRAVETREKELRAELDLKNAEVRDVRKNTHDSKLETEHYRVEHEKQTSYIATLEKKLKTAEDALEDERVFSERAAVSTLQNELEALREERRALLDASQDFSRRLRDAEDAAADAELRAADAELACEAVRAEAAAELERETEKLRSSDCRRREETSFIAEREKKSSFSRREEDDEDAVVALEDAERRARDAEARARALEAELRARDEGANKTGASPNPDATKSFSSHSELDEKENETRALRLSLERLTSRAERAERALEAAQLLARPSSVTESDAELVRLRDAGKRAAETERILRETRLKLEACEARVTDEETKRLSAESDARVLMERMNEREARLRLTEARELERTSAPTATTESSSLRLAHAKAMTLKFLEAPSFDEQQAVLPVLAAVQNWDPSEVRAVDKARALYWEPAEKVLADRLSAIAEVDLGVTSATNALAGALGLGNVL
jgi:archaellum component FlaC